MKYLSLVLKNLSRNKRRLALTILSIAVSLFVFSALVSLPAVANQIIASSSSSARVICHNKAGLTYSLPEAYKQKIAMAPHVEAVAAQSWFGGIYHEPSDQFPNFAVDSDDYDKVFPEWFAGNEAAEFKALRTACLVGPSTMHRFGWHVGQEVMLRGTIYPFNPTFKIVGEMSAQAPPTFFIFRRDYLDEMLEQQGGVFSGLRGLISNFWIKVDKTESVPTVIAAIDETFANSSAETQSESQAAFLNGFISNYRMLFHLASILGLIVVATIGLVAANTAAMSIRERRGEIAVMRSMGFSRRVILGMLLTESVIVALVGGLLGCGSAYALLKVMSVGGPALGPFGEIRMPPFVLAESLAAAVLIGFFSGFFPARSAARSNIVDALRMVA